MIVRFTTRQRSNQSTNRSSRSVSVIHQATAQSRRVSLIARTGEAGAAEPVAVESDPRRIRQILDNLEFTLTLPLARRTV